MASLRAEIPRSLQAVIARCLAKRPEDRFASTRDLAAALENPDQSPSAADFASTQIAIAPPPAPVARRGPSRRTVLALGAVVALAVAAAAWMRFHPAKSAIDSLAVLPFVNASKDPDAEFLSDGLTESLINQMSRLPSLKVMARATVFRFKGAADPQEAGRKLGVGAVLTGSVSRRGDRLLVSAELVDISTGARLWGEKYDRPFTELLRVQDSIASDISDGLRLRLSGQEKQALGRHGTQDVEAYEVARHTLRAALRQLEVEGLVRVEPNRGARVALLSGDELTELFALRLALEREAAHLALERGDGRLPAAVHEAAQRQQRHALRRRSTWSEISRAHNAVHAGLVTAGGAPRIERAYSALSTEIALFVSQLKPVWTKEQVGADHVALVRAIEREGPDVLREHMAQALRALRPGA